MAMRTYTAKPADIEKKWILIDAEGVVLGRLATIVANRLRGKHKTTFTPHMDCGDNVIIINAAKVKITGNKAQDSLFHWHTGYPGGIKSRTPAATLAGKFPERVLEKAVQRMITPNVMGRKLMRNLRVYGGTDHPHAAQNPEVLDVAKLNPKNKRG